MGGLLDDEAHLERLLAPLDVCHVHCLFGVRDLGLRVLGLGLRVCKPCTLVQVNAF